MSHKDRTRACARHAHAGRSEIDETKQECKNTYMAGKRIRGSMTSLLKQALNAAPSLNAVEKATGVKRQSLALFMRGEQPSLRSEAADKLASYFGIECSMPAVAAIKKEAKNG